MSRFNPFDAFASAPSQAAAPETRAQEPPPRWLTFRCVKCGARVYSGFTSSALERHLGGAGLVQPDFFHADCGVETSLDEADLAYEDGRPWERPPPSR